MKPIYRILGAGEWGIAVGHHLARLDHQVEIYGRAGEKFNRFKKSRLLEKLNLTIHRNVTLIDDLSVLTKSDNNCINIISTSSNGFLDLLQKQKEYLKLFKSIVWLTKGLDKNSGELLDVVIRREIGDDKYLCLISGPSFAIDLVNKKPQEVSIAGSNNSFLSTIKSSMETDHFNLIPTEDLIGVEVSGIVKNISAILAGIISALGYSSDKIELLIKLSQEEVKNLSQATYKERGLTVPVDEIAKTIISPSCIGDLELTCLSDKSRNRLFGIEFTKTKNPQELLNLFGTVEGYVSTGILAKKKGIYNSKVVDAAYRILFNGDDISETLGDFLN
tara:strand:- start:299 stop:1297 length:999 start_codon:yes stop_codon:yes gene_type:complete